jgi:NRAMP (natural resistance-associated macrophage protein)-like metal ion transporter
LGPGLITGAADDDPSGIGTYAAAGASFGMATLWTACLTFPFMAAVQHICARIGMISGKGLAGVLRQQYPKGVLYPAVFLLVVANIVNLGADLGAIADAIGLLAGIQAAWLVPFVGLGLFALQVFGRYRFMTRLFKWLVLALFAYVIDAFVVHPNVAEVMKATFVPTISLDKGYLLLLVAIMGTTISPYLFFWQADQEVEEEKEEGKKTVRQRRGATEEEIRRSTIDVNVGMGVSNLVMYFIILSTAMTLFKTGQTNIETGAQAAAALEPVAGKFAGLLFAAGMIGSGLLAVPILSGSAAFAVCGMFGWPCGLDKEWARARNFYLVILVATALGALMTFSGIKPIDALFWTAVINGILAPFFLLLIMQSARSPKVMGEQTIGPLLTTLGWTVTAAMFLVLLGLGYLTVIG